MNSDNMSICGITLDLGTSSFLRAYTPKAVSCEQHSDAAGLYAYERQPIVAHLNLTRLGSALGSVLPGSLAQLALDAYWETVNGLFLEGMRRRLGLEGAENVREDRSLVVALLKALESAQVDLNVFCRTLATASEGCVAYAHEALVDWLGLYHKRIGPETTEERETRRTRMCAVNPAVIVRSAHIDHIMAALDDDTNDDDQLGEHNNEDRLGEHCRLPRRYAELKRRCTALIDRLSRPFQSESSLFDL